jgi:hypothetical protein
VFYVGILLNQHLSKITKTYNIQGSINCKTVGVIYCILGTECETNIYVGQTGDKFYQRMLFVYEKQTTWRYKGDKRIYDVDFAEFCSRKVNVDPILCLGLTAEKF